MKKLIIAVIAISILILILLVLKPNTVSKKKETNNNTTTTKKVMDMMEGVSVNFHASIRIEKEGIVIYFDPYRISASVNDADYIFITHSHYDHYSESDIKKVMKDNTRFIVTSDLEKKVKALGAKDVTVALPNNKYEVGDLSFDAIPSYNINKSFHKREYNWVGYNVLIDGVKYFIVGDSDVTDDIKSVRCDVIFAPVGGTYTMTDKEAADFVNIIKPKYAIPIHYGVVGSRQNAVNFMNNLDADIKAIEYK